MMTLEEAIKHCKDIALSCTNKKCALEHFQLLKWLQEYSNILEKQGEQNQQGKSALEAVKEEKVDNQNCVKPADKVGPKFKVGDYIERKDGLGCHAKIIFVGGNVYGCEKLIHSEDESPFFEFMFKNQDEFQISSDFKQNPADKIEPKFKVGDFIANDYCFGKVIELTDDAYLLDTGQGIPFSCEHNAHLWTIQDAKDGDVLFSVGFHNDCIFIFDRLDNWKFDEPNGDRAVATGYCCLFVSADKMEFGMQGPDCIEVNTIKPATKIQQDLLFQKMKEAGYEWDSEKKRLKKIDNEEINGGDYGIDGLWHAQRILEKTLSSVEGYQSDDGILEHKCAISAVKKLYEQKLAEWSEEDKRYFSYAIHAVEDMLGNNGKNTVTWLKSLKDRVQPQNWTKEDKERYISCLQRLSTGNPEQPETINSKWFKEHVYSQATWKPSDEQIKALKEAADEHWEPDGLDPLYTLYQDLKKLREE